MGKKVEAIVPDEQYEDLKNFCERTKVPMAAIIKLGIDLALDEHEKIFAPPEALSEDSSS